jgi:hypothetical protein
MQKEWISSQWKHERRVLIRRAQLTGSTVNTLRPSDCRVCHLPKVLSWGQRIKRQCPGPDGARILFDHFIAISLLQGNGRDAEEISRYVDITDGGKDCPLTAKTGNEKARSAACRYLPDEPKKIIKASTP